MRDRGQEIGSQPEIERLCDLGQRRFTSQEGGPSGSQPVGVGRPAGQSVGQQDTCLLEELANRRDMQGKGVLRRETMSWIAAEANQRLARRDRRPDHEPRVGIGRIDCASRKDVHVAGEGHRHRPMREQDLRTVWAGTDEHDGRRRSRLDVFDRFARHASRSRHRCSDRAASPGRRRAAPPPTGHRTPP